MLTYRLLLTLQLLQVKTHLIFLNHGKLLVIMINPFLILKVPQFDYFAELIVFG